MDRADSDSRQSRVMNFRAVCLYYSCTYHTPALFLLNTVPRLHSIPTSFLPPSSCPKQIMAIPADAQSAALLAHVATQMQMNVAFLESQNYMSPEDAWSMRDIISRLPGGAGQSVVTTSVKVISPAAVPRAIPPIPTIAPTISPAPSQQARFVKAIWAYNEDGAVSETSFSNYFSV